MSSPQVAPSAGLNKAQVLELAEQQKVKFLRLQFTDILGTIKNVEIPNRQFEDALDGKVMFGSYGTHYEMVDAKTGKSIWKGDLGDRTHSGAAIEDGYCWFGGGSGYMYCWGP